jgi:hypothetical protein
MIEIDNYKMIHFFERKVKVMTFWDGPKKTVPQNIKAIAKLN